MNAQYALLGILNKQPSYGYELKKIYDNLFGRDKNILTGQIYSTLERLKRDRKVLEIDNKYQLATKSKDQPPKKGPDRVQYKITETGQNTLRDWLNTPEIPAPNLQATLYMKTIIALMTVGEGADYLQQQRKTHLERMRQLTHKRLHSQLEEKLLIDYAIFHIEADLRWIEITEQRLTELKKGIIL